MRPRWMAWAGLLAFLAGCSSKSGAGGNPDQPAGKVVELSGKVAAARPAAEPRPLEVGAPVYADDTVTTEPGASVLIRLSHNNAAWRLDEGRTRRVDQSLAWKAPERESGSVLEGEETGDRTAAAGRHSEREAAETRATAMADPEGAADEAASTEPTAAAAQDEAPSKATRPVPKTREKRRRPRRKSKSSRPEPSGVSGLESEPSLEAAPAPPPPPPPPEPSAKAEAPPSKTRGTSVDPEAQIRSKLKVCHALAEDAPTGWIVAAVTIDSAGKIVEVDLSRRADGLDSVARCAKKKLLGTKVSGAKPGRHELRVNLR